VILKVIVDVMKYLTDRVIGRPTQTIEGNPEQPVTDSIAVVVDAGMVIVSYG